MKRLEEEKKATLMERMKKIAEEAQQRREQKVTEEDDMRVIEDTEERGEGLMSAGECSPEEYIKAHMDPNREMVEIYEESDGKWYTVPAFETGVYDNVKTEEEIVAEANNWKVTVCIIAGIVTFIALVLWVCITLIA